VHALRLLALLLAPVTAQLLSNTRLGPVSCKRNKLGAGSWKLTFWLETDLGAGN
jgi:hypothetical protein